MICLLYLSIDGLHLDYDLSLTRSKEVDLMVELLGSNIGEIEYQVKKMKGAHARFSAG